MSTRPRVLLLALEPAWPAAKGISRRVEALAEALAEAAELVVVDASALGSGGGRPATGRVIRLPRSTSRLSAVAGMAAAAAAGRPVTTAFYRRPLLRRQLRHVLTSEDPSVVVVHGLGGAALVEGLVDPSHVVLDLADAEHERFRELGRRLGLRGLPYRLDAGRTARWCRRHLAAYGLVSTVSEHDAAAYRELAPQAALAVAPNGVTLQPQVRPDPGGRRLMFLGDLRYQPNAEALGWLVEHVLPLLPEVTLRVVGAGAAPAHERLEAAGFVDDLDDEWRAAVCLVAPIRSGGGTRVKVVEAMAAGVPVVATALGASGLGAVPGEHYLQAETPEEFVSAVERVLADPQLRAALAAAGRELVEARFQWRDCMRPVAGHVARASLA